MKKIIASLILAVSIIAGHSIPALAIAAPDSAPSVLSSDIHVYRNSLETGDMLIVFRENTPYATTPTDFTYPQAFVWRLIDTDGTTEIAQALGYVYNESGFGYNVISFYLSAAEFTAAGLAWGDALFLRLSETPAAFASPTYWTFAIPAGAYSSLTVTADVKAAIAAQVLAFATQLDTNWGLSGTTSLLSDSETGTVLSLYGQAFFRGAIFGVQSLAPAAFPLIIENINTDPRMWSANYSSALAAQMAGTSLETAFTAGETFLDVGYNLFGLLLVIGMIIFLVICNWMLAGSGSVWRGFIDAGGVLVIGSRLTLIGLGEVGLVAAICWIYVSAKQWRMI